MSLSKTLSALTLSALLALTACGDKKSPSSGGVTPGGALKTEPVANDLAKLVPADSDIVLYVPSMDALQAKVRRVVGAIDPEAAAEVDVDEMLGEIAGPLLDLVDKKRPMAIAARMSEGGGEPLPTIILPLVDVAAGKERFQGQGAPTPAVSGSYLAFAAGPVPATVGGESAITKDLPAGDLVVRVNLARLAEVFGDQIREGLSEGLGRAGDMPPQLAGFQESMKGMVENLLDSAERLDLAISVEETRVDLRGAFTAKAGSPMDAGSPASGDLAGMAALLPDGYPIVALMSFDWRKVMDWIQPLMDAAFASMPEEQRGRFEAQWTQSREAMQYLGDRHAVAVRIGGGKGMSVIGISEAKDAKAYMQKYEEMLSPDSMSMLAEMGIGFAPEGTSTVAGHQVKRYRITMDMQKLMAMSSSGQDMPPEAAEASKEMMDRLFGPEGMTMAMAEVNGRLVYVMGDDQVLEQTITRAAAGGGSAKGVLAEAIARAGGKPSFLLHMDLRALLQDVMVLVKDIAPAKAQDEIPSVPAGGPVPVTIHASAAGRTFTGGLSIDVKQVADLIKGMRSPR